MSLKTSLFNKSILKSDIKRFWWVALLETLFIFGISVVPVWENCRRAGLFGAGYRMCAPTWENGAIVFLILFAIGVGVGLFTYMHFSASVSMHHSIPVRRETMLFTKLLTGALLTIVPVIINSVIFTMMLADPLFRNFYGMSDVINWVASGVLYTLVLLSLTVVVNMITGNPVGTLIFTGGFTILPLLICSFSEYFFYEELFGYTESITDVLNKIYIFEDELVTFPYYLIYIAFSAIFIFGAYMFYKKRKLENHGEVIAFGWLKPVFITIVAILASMASYIYFKGVVGLNSVLALIPIGLLGTVIAWMIARKSISLHGVLKPVLLYVVCTLAFCAVIHFDITGFERRVPDTEDIEKVQVVTIPEATHEHYYDGEWVTFVTDPGIDKRFYEKSDIENVRALHQHLIEQKDSSEIRTNTIPIVYTLKNGKTLIRKYNIDFRLDKEYLKPIYETPQMKAELFSIVDGREHKYETMIIADRRINGGVEMEIYPDNPYMQKIVDALSADIAEVKYEEFAENDGASTTVNVSYKNKGKTKDGECVFDEACEEHVTYYIRTSYKNTMAVLKEMGFYDKLPTISDIEKVVVETWDADDEMSAKDIIVEKTATDVTNPEEIKILYNFYDEMIEIRKYSKYEESKNISISYVIKGGAYFGVSCSYDPDKIPEELTKYFK